MDPPGTVVEVDDDCQSSKRWGLSKRSGTDNLKDGAPGNNNTQEGGAVPQRGMFADLSAENLKEQMRQNMCKEKYEVTSKYKTTGIFQKIARNQKFENLTLSVIALNALWISIDTDNNHADVLLTAHPVFQVAENFFCAYFSFEWFVRYKAFARKVDGLKDAWFVFDSSMVFMMVMETWVMTIVLIASGAGGGGGGLGNAAILRLLRLLRLSRMARMARLLRSMPELLILIKGMIAAMRSVFFTFVLLVLLIYVFAIALVQLTVGTPAGETYFTTVPGSMNVLLLQGTFLDGLGTIARDLEQENLIFLLIFYVFMLFSALLLMNMLIGVLCEVVSAVAAAEKEAITVGYVSERLKELMEEGGLDEDQDGRVSKDEFIKILGNDDAIDLLQDVGVDALGLVDMVDEIFASPAVESLGDDEPISLSFTDFMEIILQLRGSNTATTKDVVDLRKFVRQFMKHIETMLLHGRVPAMSSTDAISTSPHPSSGNELRQLGSRSSESTCGGSHPSSNCSGHEEDKKTRQQ